MSHPEINPSDPSTYPWNLGLTPRWFTIPRYHPEHERFWFSTAQIEATRAGRRSYKTELHKRRGVVHALTDLSFPDRRIGFGAPTRDQAKDIFWNDLKAMIPHQFLACSPHESELKITLKHGTEIRVFGLDVAARREGVIWDELIVDEIDNCKGDIWWENLYPALFNEGRLGRAALFSVPEKGRELLRELVEKAEGDDTGTWTAYFWKSAEVIDPSIVAEARARMDLRTFRREWEASFETVGGLAYYPYERNLHAATELTYDPERPLVFCFDFNVAPGVAAVLQEQQKEFYRLKGVELPAQVADSFTAVIGQVYIPDDSNTPRVCRKLTADWGERHKGKVLYYGDATGGARSTTSEATNWRIVRNYLSSVFSGRLSDRVPLKNPGIVDRVNAVNTRLMTADERIHLLVCPKGAPDVVRDLEGVGVIEGTAGEPDESDGPRGHIMAAIGYYIAERFPVIGAGLTVTRF